MKVTVLAPAYNEEAVIEKFVRTVMDQLGGLLSFDMLIVNDGSSDRTGEILLRLQQEYNNLAVVTHPVNQGLGAGLKTGFSHAKGDVVVTLDADLSQPPSLIPKMIEEIKMGADVVIGSRYIQGGGMKGVPRWRMIISRLGNWLIRNSLDIRVKDCTSGLRAYRRGAVQDLGEIGSGFEVQLKILQQLVQVRFAEIPLNLVNRTAGESKMRYFSLVPRYLFLLAFPCKKNRKKTKTFVFEG
ncbi:glycosyltransferase family 2 protein [Desulforamulus ruminis]|uniref:Glycosyl transferase family 2 n=1 Tax=Desulforamulus ruminis (strain ATCC 23193 / DSM 2154 / NCIMB 8452 / DL) TaxID=696281 RepID=F6DQ17_DESRL|nr:glycosyltransferase family 2 protein [Desulforamulus ruminis]AEG61961.1 glycosyl transferase family 2 [Desulforamulus ruminis DSM 2154]